MGVNEDSIILIQNLTKNIQNWKKSNEISQRKIAVKSGVAESTLRAIMKKAQNIEIATLVKLKLAFSVEIPDLLKDNVKNARIIPNPLPLITVKKEIVRQQVKIGKNIYSAMKRKNMSAEYLSIIAFNTDYSDTIKYLKGQVNLTLITILKFAYALEVEIWELL